MSAFGAAIAKGLGGLGGPGAAAAIVAGGILVGALGGGIAATQGSGQQPASATGKLAVFACPDSGAPLVMIGAGQKLLVTGRTEDSAWLRIHFPEPGRTEAWVQASPLTVAGEVASLPVSECASELAVAPPSIEPGMTLTAVANNPPSAPPTTAPEVTPTPAESPTESPTATPTAEPNSRPTLASLTVSTRKISYDTGAYCPNAVKKVTFRVKAGDGTSVDGVALFWRKPGAGGFARAPMSRISGSATSGTWQVTLDTTADAITKAGRLAYYAVATDSAGATRRLPVEGSNSISVAVCVNTGPTITAVSPASGTRIYWDPLSAGGCQTALNITATVKDADGVKSATLFYRKPGSATWLSKPMDNQTIAGKWYANLDTLGDKITITDPPTDNLRWYIKAVDDKGKASQLAARTLQVRRCDTEASFKGPYPSGSCTAAGLALETYATDRDQPNGGLRTVFEWRIENPRRPDFGTISGNEAGRDAGGGYYRATITFDTKLYYQARLTLSVTTTDLYGGSTTSSAATFNFGCQ
ncbi:MAG TPA: hypothetical protein VES19_12305 [Candidatus Limnocylindrales bacterium]|nr:hypothetical protein [Candidatus Limnocylindrales bacterium]